MIQQRLWTRASDVYSFGVLVFEVASGGLLPFHREPDPVVIALMAKPEADLAAVLFAGLSPAPSPAL